MYVTLNLLKIGFYYFLLEKNKIYQLNLNIGSPMELLNNVVHYLNKYLYIMIHVLKNDLKIPVIFALMSDKTQSLYER